MTVAAALQVETRGLSKRYGNGVLAVDRLDLAVRSGEVYGFLGPNGAGKTTTLRMLVGLIQPSEGSATVAGRPAGNPRGLSQVGAMIEAPALYPYLSGRENLRVIASYCRAPRPRIDAALAQVDLAAAADRSFATYSTGMRQRLGLAAALLKDPPLLILDEPSNGLDPQGMVEMRDLIRSLSEGGRTVLLSSHLLAEVQQICDRVGVIHRGRLVAEGTVAELRGGSGLALVATPVEKAKEVLAGLLGADAVTEREGGLSVAADPRRAAELNRALVTAGVDVSELRPVQRSLEDVFLQLTEGQHE